MPSSTLPQQEPPSPSPSDQGRGAVVTRATTDMSSSGKMLKIHSLLNPEDTSASTVTDDSCPPTPSFTATTRELVPPTRLGTPVAPSAAKKQKLAKDAPVFTQGTPLKPVNYEPFESTEDAVTLTNAQQQELRHQHERFGIWPNGRDADGGRIRDYVKHIPYQSEKKGFFAQTGRNAFEVFQYVFSVPDDPANRHFTVMWDYQIGLVRITPFFKACNHNKTTPAKALSANPDLKELSYSITGGALVAQGYWVPYACARAICLTFCYPIRWALTPVFGPSFIKDCIPTGHPGFQRYKIDRVIVRNARLEADSWKMQASRSATPATPRLLGAKDIPRSVPPTSAPSPGMIYGRDRQTPQFEERSPFSSGKSCTKPRPQELDEPSLSPKTSPTDSMSPAHTTWNSINRPYQSRSSPFHKSAAQPLASTMEMLNRPLPRDDFQHASWRDSEGSRTPEPREIQRANAAAGRRAGKRPARELDEDYEDDGGEATSDSSQASSCTSDSDPDIVTSPPPPPARRAPPKKKLRRTAPSATAASRSATPSSTKVTSADWRAAQVLLQMSKGEDTQGVDHEHQKNDGKSYECDPLSRARLVAAEKKLYGER